MTLNPISWLAASVLAVPTAILLTELARKHAIRRAILDHPNDRSSHIEPTPRGGGIAIVVVSLLFVAVAGATGLMQRQAASALGVGGALVAWVGWRDDVKGLPARVRLLAHSVAAIMVVVGIGGMPTLSLGFGTVYLGPLGGVLAAIGIIWSANLFNFMDGIDGIAGVETAFVTGLGGSFLLLAGSNGLGVLSLVIAGASLGFLVWNWPPARIFMGDVGSGFVGFMVAGIALVSERAAQVPILIWAILGAAFILDATVTFLRLLPHKPWSEAHRHHAYQRAVQSGWSHLRVSCAVVAINVVLGVLASFALLYPQATVALTVGAFAFVGSAYYIVERVRPLGPKTR